MYNKQTAPHLTPISYNTPQADEAQTPPGDSRLQHRTGNSEGCITSTPKLLTFLKKTRFSAKNERACCMPGAKNGERPYLAVPEATFWGLFLPCFFAHFPPILPSYPTVLAPGNLYECCCRV